MSRRLATPDLQNSHRLKYIGAGVYVTREEWCAPIKDHMIFYQLMHSLKKKKVCLLAFQFVKAKDKNIPKSWKWVKIAVQE